MRFTLQIGQILQFLRYKTYILYTVYPPYPLNDLRFRGTLLITTLVNWSIVRTLSGPGLLRTRRFEVIATRDAQRELDHLVRHSIQQRSATP